MKGQMSFELLVVVAFVLLIMIPLIFFFYSKSNEASITTSGAFANAYLDSITSAADMAYYSGNNSFISLYVRVPDNLEGLEAQPLGSGSILIANISGNQITKISEANISISNVDKLIRPGRKIINVTYNGQNVLVS